MIYHWKTIVQDVLVDLDIQESLDDDITEICQKGAWEVWQIDIIHWTESSGRMRPEHIVQRIVTLRSSETVGEKLQPGDIPIMQSAMQEMRRLNHDVHDTLPDSVDRHASLRIFHSHVERILGLK